MKVKLLKADTLDLVDHAASECYDTKPKDDEAKRFIRVHKICNVYKHDSLAEFGSAVWEIEASTKVLLEMTRHRMASYACKSSRYTLNRSEVVFESTGDAEVDMLLSDWKQTIEKMILSGKKNDIVSLMLPQAYQYRWQVQMNFRSMKNFFALRLNKTAHFQIREVAEKMYNLLPKHIQDFVVPKNIE